MRTVPQIDKAINALRRTMPRSPDFSFQETVLFRERGLAQLERDQKEERERIRIANRPLKRKRCPTCHNLSSRESKMAERTEFQKRTINLARYGFAGSLAAVFLATLSARNGNWFLWAVNCGLFLVCAACTIRNYRLAKRS